MTPMIRACAGPVGGCASTGLLHCHCDLSLFGLQVSDLIHQDAYTLTPGANFRMGDLECVWAWSTLPRGHLGLLMMPA